MSEEVRMFKCWRYYVNTYITYGYTVSDTGEKILAYATCSLRDSGKPCDGFQSPGVRCGLLPSGSSSLSTRLTDS